MSTNSTTLQVGDTAPPLHEQPVFGLPVQVPAPTGPVVLIFVPSLGSPLGRDAMFAAQARQADFDRRGVKLVAITSSGLSGARDFVPRHHLLFPLIVDAQGTLHRDYGVGRDRWGLGTLRSLSRERLHAAARSARHGLGRLDVPLGQLSAQFVVDGDGKLAYVHYAASLLDALDLDALLECSTRT